MQKYFNKTKFFNEINVFYRRIKLKDQKIKPKTEEDIFRKPTDKTWIPQKNHYTIDTFIEATNNEINQEIHIRNLQDLQERNDILIANADKG